MAERVTTTLALSAMIAVCVVLLSLDFASAAYEGGSPGGLSSHSSRRSSSSYSSSRRVSVSTTSSRRSSSSVSSSRRASESTTSSRRSSSSVSSSRRVSESTSSVRYGTRYYVVAPLVHIYGYTSYKSRHLYANSRDDDPTVCYSEEETGYNGTALGYFVCPMADDPDSYNYCCGDDDEQYCCDYWGDSGRAAGAVIGIISGIAVLIAAVVVMWKCCCQNTTKLTVHKRLLTVSGANTFKYVPLDSMPPVTATAEKHRYAAAAFDTSQASAGPALPYSMSSPNYGLQPATKGAGCPQPQPHGLPSATSVEPRSIGFEGAAP